MKRNYTYLLLLFVAFIFISILTVLPDRDYIGNFTSAELKLEEKTDNKLTTYTYVDASGKTTFAIDKGYEYERVRPR